ncbi:MAG: type II toxin-antitoxin system PemK/MazF family toxin [Anaerolineales bacterium]|jgi:mRNA interferase MazF|nr:type II toxin-antitoxin system PemK/MazF family toxin [Anaerolineales bacterium]
MTTYRQGDVLLVPFPFTDQSGVKQRPAVVLSGVDYNRTHPDLILAPITSQVTNVLDEILLTDWKSAGLLKPGAVKPVVSSFELTLVRKQLGKLTAKDLQLFRATFKRILELK